MAILRFLMFLSLTVWIGGIIFLSFVEAPTAFSVIPSRHMAGTVVGHSLGGGVAMHGRASRDHVVDGESVSARAGCGASRHCPQPLITGQRCPSSWDR